MRLEFGNVHFDGDVSTRWEVMLRIVGDFSVRVAENIIYREAGFCLVEFAVALANWLAMATDLGPDFVYTSLESETEGLVRFTRLQPGMWQVSAALQEREDKTALNTVELKRAAREYIQNLRDTLLPEIDISEYLGSY